MPRGLSFIEHTSELDIGSESTQEREGVLSNGGKVIKESGWGKKWFSHQHLAILALVPASDFEGKFCQET